METERGHVSVRRGMSWSLAGGRKPFQSGDTETINRETDASWERRDDRGVKGQMTSASTNQQAWKTKCPPHLLHLPSSPSLPTFCRVRDAVQHAVTSDRTPTFGSHRTPGRVT
ncbi:hypothetical protein UPYG_G00218930 [Umbra pygmaea]|uniref:Uncharacterized protein n=1 Tax=Umbra pygmaea TaxID=75934 RepID=A0ABD0WLC5_UMBPY